jgi:signal peptidase I
VDRDVYSTTESGAGRGRGIEGDPRVLMADEFFVLGDNSPNSSDSRRWENEPFVSRDHLIGKAFFVYWPSAGPAPGLPVRIVPKVTDFRFIR